MTDEHVALGIGRRADDLLLVRDVRTPQLGALPRSAQRAAWLAEWQGDILQKELAIIAGRQLLLSEGFASATFATREAINQLGQINL